MRKTVALLLSFALMFALCACNSGAANSDVSAPSSDASGFVKPAEYAAVITMTINPQFALYLDENNKVLAVETLNDDAVIVKKDADLSDTNVEAVIRNLLTAANKNGFVKANATVGFEMTECLSTALKIADVLNKASTAAQDAATDLQLTITVSVTDRTASTTATEQGSQTTAQPQNTTKPQSATKPQNTTAAHQHSYAPASCTAAAKCACGATSGSALGHQWQAATCKAPKTCSVCKVTEGAIGAHKFVNGVCSVCKASDVLNPKENIKFDEEYVSRNYKPYDDNSIYAGGVTFYNDSVDGQYALLLEAMFEPENNGRTGVSYKGKTYYRVGAGQTPYKMEFTNTEIIIKNSFYDEIETVSAKMVLQSDGNLKVTYSVIDRFDVGDILSISYNGLT